MLKIKLLICLLIWQTCIVPSVIATTDREQLGLISSVLTLDQEDRSEGSSNGLTVHRTYNAMGNESIVISTGDYQGKPSPTGLIAIPIYGANGNKTREFVFQFDGSSYEKTLYAYDIEGKRVAEATYDESGELRGLNKGGLKLLRLFMYDSIGRKSESLHYSPFTGLFLEKIVYFDDDRGNIIESTSYYNNGGKSIQRYNAKHQLMETTGYRADGSYESKTIFSYDNRGNEIESRRSRADGIVDYQTTQSYVYDHKGNWIKRTSNELLIRDGKSHYETGTIIRTITYLETGRSGSDRGNGLKNK